MQNIANAPRSGHLLRRLQQTWTYGPSRRASGGASPRAYHLDAPPDGLTTTDWNRRTNLHHAGTGLTHLGELGLGLQYNDITAAAWDATLLPDTDSGSDDVTESVASSIDSNDNVYVFLKSSFS